MVKTTTEATETKVRRPKVKVECDFCPDTVIPSAMKAHVLSKHPEMLTSIPDPKVPDGSRPGTYVTPSNRGFAFKVPWSYEKMAEAYKDDMATFVPNHNIHVTWNGVKVRLIAGEEHRCPAPIKAIYDDYVKGLTQQGRKYDPDGIPPEGQVFRMAGAGPPTDV